METYKTFKRKIKEDTRRWGWRKMERPFIFFGGTGA
jgi:hypothetical protein